MVNSPPRRPGAAQSGMSDRWAQPCLDVANVAEILGTIPATVRQKLLKDNAFPAPLTKGANGRNLWAPATVYQYAREHHAERRDRTPRLWTPRTLNPARFLGTWRLTVRPRWLEPDEVFAVHGWQPSDEGGPIAIAYPLNTNRRPRTLPDVAAEDLFRQLSPGFTAVAVPTGEAGTVPGTTGDTTQPMLAVVDTSTAGRTDGPAVEYGWY